MNGQIVYVFISLMTSTVIPGWVPCDGKKQTFTIVRNPCGPLSLAVFLKCFVSQLLFFSHVQRTNFCTAPVFRITLLTLSPGVLTFVCTVPGVIRQARIPSHLPALLHPTHRQEHLRCSPSARRLFLQALLQGLNVDLQCLRKLHSCLEKKAPLCFRATR